jgi:hypothetical protein
MPAGGGVVAAVEKTDVVQAQETALEDIVSPVILAVHPPGEIEQQLLKNPFQKQRVAPAALLPVDGVDLPRGPGMDGRIHVVKRPLVGGNLSVGVHVPFPGEKIDLPFGESGIETGERNGVKGGVPDRKPGILPFVRHGEDVVVVEVQP